MTERTSEILMFQVGARVFAAEVYDVVRIGSVHDVGRDEVLGRSALGAPFSLGRGIVVAEHGVGERTLAVDQVLGIRSVPETDVHPLPAFAAACIQSAAITGFVILDDSPTLLIDLPTLVREGLPPAADSERT